MSSIPASQSSMRESNSQSSRKFTFERQIPVVSMAKKRKPANLKGDNSTTSSKLQTALQNNIPASPSGHSLSQILSLSYPNDLSSYHIESVTAGRGIDGTLVKYSRPQGTEADLLREKEELQRKVVELERIEIEKRNAVELLTKWQTANLVLQAFGTFVWPLISDEDRNELVKYGMTNFHDICSVRRSRLDSTERRLARRVYLKIDEDVRFLGEEIISSKQQLRDERHMLAHPTISDTQLKASLKDLGDGVPTLKLIEIEAFNYLKVTTNTQANIEASRR